MPEWHAEAIQRGAALRRSRVARRETLKDAARRAGVKPAQLSRLEQGLEHPDKIEALARCRRDGGAGTCSPPQFLPSLRSFSPNAGGAR